MTITRISRRQFLKTSTIISASLAGPIFFTGCAVNPVTGKKQLMMVSPQQEIGIDREQSPFQFSSDYGITKDPGVNEYISDVGRKLLPNVHRPQMPYSFQCVNATYINAYAFPGGTIAVTRGILLKLNNEAQLAALLGHELGHVNARHSAEQVSKGQLSSLLLAGLSIAASTKSSALGDLTQQLGMLGQGLLLSKYSRDNEREADSLGNEYMVKAGYSSKGFVQLMEMLDSLNKTKPSSAQVLFSTHPMSTERLTAAVQRETGIYQHSKNSYLNGERYMDSLASLRTQKSGIELLQQGENHLGKKEYDKAQKLFIKSLNTLKNDYTAHVLMAKCHLLRKKPEQALAFAEIAKKIYPSEVQGHYIAGIAEKELKKYTMAYKNFDTCDRLLPGNPQMIFYKGYCLDKKGNIKPAATNYMTYLNMTRNQPNEYGRYDYNRLRQWGYAK
jgi:predicted Zn-dependent protease